LSEGWLTKFDALPAGARETELASKHDYLFGLHGWAMSLAM
jgi:hypothetical protein